METSKACQDTDISTTIIKDNADTFANILLASFNDSVEKSNFPSFLKYGNLTPVFEKGDRNSKDNYRPASIHRNMSKTTERFIFHQLYSFMLELSYCKNTSVVFARVTVHSIVC